MEKYIRTKDRIYEVIEENSNYYKCCYDNGRITLVAKFDNDVNGFSKALKQADTIDKLCDEFVVIRNVDDVPQLVRTDNIKFLKELIENDKRITAVYGAVWCEWGLKYVAKMNNNGKLILI